MQRCLQLAAKARVYPNPMVGAVVVHEGKIIGEGYHQVFGGSHAEVNAIRSVKDQSLLSSSIIYVSLEPCCHWGKTPPCSQLIIESGIKTVVIGCVDPNPLMAGKGIKQLRDSGVNVIMPVLENDCIKLNSRFFSLFDGSPKLKYLVKWAETSDGFMGKENYQTENSKEISNDLVKRYVHKLRHESDAIMIGTNTALTDNPQLDSRCWMNWLPKVILIDKSLKIPLNSRLFEHDREVIIINGQIEDIQNKVKYCKIDFANKNEFWSNLNIRLVELGIGSVLLEGGSQTIQSFFETNYPCNIVRIIAPIKWNSGIRAPRIYNTALSVFDIGDNRVELYSI